MTDISEKYNICVYKISQSLPHKIQKKKRMASEMNSSMHSRRLGPHGTPESEFNHFECFQNYTAPEVFVQGLAGIVNQGDIELMIRAQKQM